MGKYKHPGKPQKRDRGQFIALPYEMIKHPAFATLSSDAVRVLIEMHLGFYGINNGEISFSTRQAMKCLHSGSGRAKKAVDELQDHGFLVCHAQSSFNMKSRKAREWEITFQPMPNRPPSNAWRKNTVLE